MQSADRGPGLTLAELEQFGNMRSWRHTTSLGVTSEFSIRTVDNAQHIRFERRVGHARPRVEGVAFGAFFALVFATILAAVTRSPVMFVAGFFGGLAIFAPATEWFDRRWRGRIQSEMHGAVDEVVRLISEPEKAESEARIAGSDPLSAGLQDESTSDLRAVLDEDADSAIQSGRSGRQRAHN